VALTPMALHLVHVLLPTVLVGRVMPSGVPVHPSVFTAF